MKKDIEADSVAEENKKDIDIEIESVNDIIERIESLSYEGRRHIIAYLKSKIAKNKND